MNFGPACYESTITTHEKSEIKCWTNFETVSNFHATSFAKKNVELSKMSANESNIVHPICWTILDQHVGLVCAELLIPISYLQKVSKKHLVFLKKSFVLLISTLGSKNNVKESNQ